MDFVLHSLDDLVLDSIWAKVVPLSAFAALPTSESSFFSNVSSTAYDFPQDSSTWSSVIKSLPHPALPSLDYASSTLHDLSNVSAWPRDYVPRQLLSLMAVTIVGINIMYFLFAGLSYQFIFNHEMMKHPRFLKNQVKMEMQTSMKSFPGMALLTLPWFQAEVMGYSKLYDSVDEYGWAYLVFSIFWFLLFTDYCIYWIHRWLHIPAIYKHIHKPHHKWIVPTPFASHAFHPVDGYAQSIPYHLFIFLFPIQRHLYLGLFVAVNFWTIFIHDSDMITGHPLEKIINGPAHHTLHHLHFTVNYGQYFTWADRAGGSYRHPTAELDPMLEVKAAMTKKDDDCRDALSSLALSSFALSSSPLSMEKLSDEELKTQR